MLAPAVAVYEVVLAIHIMAVVVAFGVTFAYPIIFAVVAKADPRSTAGAAPHRVHVGQRLIQPGLAVVLLAGVYLASELHEWSEFFVQWGLAAAIVLGALAGMFFTPIERRLSRARRARCRGGRRRRGDPQRRVPGARAPPGNRRLAVERARAGHDLLHGHAYRRLIRSP